MKKTVLIHAGFHKTATTFDLSMNFGRLKKEIGHKRTMMKYLDNLKLEQFGPTQPIVDFIFDKHKNSINLAHSAILKVNQYICAAPKKPQQ